MTSDLELEDLPIFIVLEPDQGLMQIYHSSNDYIELKDPLDYLSL